MNIKPMHILLVGCVMMIAGIFVVYPLGEALIGTGVVLFIASGIAAVSLDLRSKSTSECQQRPPPTPNNPPRKV